MDKSQAAQIATLLNQHNQLTVQYCAEKVLEHQDNYLVRLDSSGCVLACAELKKVQWYQFELLHVTVAQEHHRQGHARALVMEAEKKAIELGARILQSTIRVGNTASEELFKSSGFNSVCRFYNESSKNIISVWQRVLSPPPFNTALKGDLGDAARPSAP